jgi:hypothetical protein
VAHDHEERAPVAVGDLDRALDRPEPLGQLSRDDRVPAVGLGGAHPQQLVAEMLADLHASPGRLEPRLHAQGVHEGVRDTGLEVARGASHRPARQHGASRLEVREGARDVQVLGVDGIDQAAGVAEP